MYGSQDPEFLLGIKKSREKQGFPFTIILQAIKNPVNLFIFSSETEFKCNQTLHLSRDGTSLPVSSPAYPSTYPDNTHCVTRVETSPGYRIIVEFDEFLLEDSPR
jgi:hypothetical protein